MEGSADRGGAGTGIDALVLILRFHDIAVDPAQIRHQFGTSAFGISEILRCAKELKLKARALTTDWTRLAKTALPALAECRDGSFVVLGRIVGDKALVQDPKLGRPQLVSRDEFEARWTGRLVLIARRRSTVRLKLRIRRRSKECIMEWTISPVHLPILLPVVGDTRYRRNTTTIRDGSGSFYD